MATQFAHDCPHCLTKGAGFTIAYQWGSRGPLDRANLLAVCGVCNLGMTIESYDVGSSSHSDLIRNSVDYPGSRFLIRATWPQIELGIPEGVPENVGKFYSQGLENLRAERWDAAGAMFRKSLDVSTKIIDVESRDKTLFARINHLVTNGLLTPAMGDWAHEIRLDGNSAVHDEEPETGDDAAATQKFAEAFLIYSFSLPQLVAENRAGRER